LRIERYFEQIQALIETRTAVESFTMAYDKRSTYDSYLRGEVRFIDGSTLHLREFVDTETRVERLTYAYHYVDVAGQLVFRYDNSGHHRQLALSTYSHHKHVAAKSEPVASDAPDLAEVLQEISQQVDTMP
jgi:hypothetical protein